jgi:hypothetical protein
MPRSNSVKVLPAKNNEKRRGFPAISLFLVLAFTACASSNYGYSEERWYALSPVQQQAAKQEYEEILKRKKDREHDALLRERDEQVIWRGPGESD